MIETVQAFGVDIGGSGIKAAPVDLTKGDFAEPRLKILTPEVSTPQAVAKIVKQQLDHFEVPESAPVGIAFPAPIKPGQKLDFMANLDQSWIGVDVTEVFSEACGRPVVVVNDADAAGLAEVQFGAAKGQDGLVIATTLGTGIGTALIYNGVLTFALDGFSKMLAAPHAKVGWIQVSGPAEDVAEAQRRLDVIADDYLPMSDIIAERIPALLNAAPAQTRRVGERVRNNLAKLHELLDADPNGLVSVLRAEGGWNVLLRVPSVIDENELVLRLIDEHKLTGQPGYFFDMTSNGYLAVSLLPEPDEFERGIRAVLNTVAALLR